MDSLITPASEAVKSRADSAKDFTGDRAQGAEGGSDRSDRLGSLPVVRFAASRVGFTSHQRLGRLTQLVGDAGFNLARRVRVERIPAAGLTPIQPRKHRRHRLL